MGLALDLHSDSMPACIFRAFERKADSGRHALDDSRTAEKFPR
jgi:hypothetical protein